MTRDYMGKREFEEEARDAKQEEETCPICAKPFMAGDLWATDIELGICHAACLHGSPTVNLDTGEPNHGPIGAYAYEPDTQSQEAGAGPELADEIDNLARSVGKRFVPSHPSQTNPAVSHETENVTHKPTITDEMLERAALAVYRAAPCRGYDEQIDMYKAMCRLLARAALHAALSDDGGDK